MLEHKDERAVVLNQDSPHTLQEARRGEQDGSS